MKVYVITANYVNDGCEESAPVRVFASKEKAVACLKSMKDDLRGEFVKGAGWIAEETKTGFTAYSDGEFCMNHCGVYLDETEVIE